ncbi:RimJ/RimL family protein N-acetyltransferase [Chryseomicrobium aureum]|uniref:GNAT family N-acetyltransferase n=1 Tax=Chryseomicrobium aureum TaxID=1441723 RepID=UPI00195EB518|nr:GNAT family N-acetyltransferase [Chryseomicrobium aureum]MBM7707321.1 RimJ/RimL family protein N-acetyltransferase [Chryseomicrobium aureum]
MNEVTKIEPTSQAIFESERCYVRRFAESDLDAFVDYRNNVEWMKYQSFKGYSRKEYKEILLKETTLESGAQFAIVRKADQTLIGDVFIKKEDTIFWIGYTVSPSFKRQGYASEVVQTMVEWIQQQGDYQIMAGVAKENSASIELLRKLQFKQVDDEDGELFFQLSKPALGII